MLPSELWKWAGLAALACTIAGPAEEGRAHPRVAWPCSYAAWMVAQGMCTLTCGRCACPGQCACSDVPPDGRFTCVQQAGARQASPAATALLRHGQSDMASPAPTWPRCACRCCCCCAAVQLCPALRLP